MIFKECDIINVAENKKAIQSSISAWSFKNDLKSDLEVQDFAFHTGFEENPWWMVDLEDEIEIDCIRLTNRTNKSFQENLKNIKVELSLDKNSWITLDHSMFEWQNGFDILDINIYQVTKARYIKISLNGWGHLYFKKCEVFVKNVKGYVIASRGDGLGMRLTAMITGIWLAKKLDFKFAFIWEEGDFLNMPYIKNKDIVDVSMASKEEVFSKEYLQEYATNGEALYGYPASLKDEFFENNLSWFKNPDNLYKNYGYYTADYFLHYIEKFGFYQELKECFESIDFSDKFKEIQNYSKIIKEQLSDHSNKICALHIRGAEWVYSDDEGGLHCPNAWINSRFFPYELALEIAKTELSNGNSVIIFSQDRSVDLRLIKHIKKELGEKSKIVRAVDLFSHKNYTNFEEAFFEINLMSKADKIYATGSSGFSLVAQAISANTNQSIYQLYSTKELCEIIIKNINLKTSDKQKAMSYYFIYYFLREDNFNKAFSYLKKAIETNDKSITFKVIFMDCLFRLKEFDQIEFILKNLVKSDLRELEGGLYGSGTYFGWIFDFYENIRKCYTNFQNKQNYPYISFIAAKISFHKQDTRHAEQYLQFCLQKEPNNEIFLEFYEQLKYKNNVLLTGKNQQESIKTSAVSRIKSHLSYKLGQAMIENSKSIKGYIRMPYVLSYIKDKHKQEQRAYERSIKENPSLKLPPLETYSDYKEALKIKEHLSYKLGEAWIRAYKNWYKGGFIKFIFIDAPKIKKDFKNKKINKDQP
ncbi:hypothetical protein DMB92_01875 [Campylobacter sp. MIT 99-7217]|uniref:discoidin domain-containing protein n=1 Tax=Campylobacter sp. MIT 99-7217 TaxID=535091 RepID=UPI00115A1557|nr:discoidin domain-containing protein [Campylobacter sp. MIT 99-7217]TQR33657.1 hypothetical protein DMB92_01875 [Campylobacter sp. MIT 99-7217]